MSKILLIQSRERADLMASERRNFERAMRGVAQLDCMSAVDESLAWENPEGLVGGYNGVIFGGSAEFDIHGGRDEADPARLASMRIIARVRILMEYMKSVGKPVLGICFGHQLIAEVYGGNVTHDHSQKKCGTYEVSLTEEGKRDPLFANMPQVFAAQYAHKDSVTSLPEGAIQLADGSACRFSALRYGSSIYTMQFHPELEPAEHIVSLNRCGYLPEGVKAESVVRESPEVSRIIPLWLERIV